MATHRQRAARRLSEDVQIPYQRALAAIEESLGAVYPSRGHRQQPPAEAIPEPDRAWVAQLDRIGQLRDEYVRLRLLARPTFEDLAETHAVFEALRRTCEEAGWCNVMDETPFDRVLEEGVRQAVAGTFDGWPGRFEVYDPSEIWEALVRVGLAYRDDRGWCLSEAGLAAFAEGEAWSPSYLRLVDSVE